MFYLALLTMRVQAFSFQLLGLERLNLLLAYFTRFDTVQLLGFGAGCLGARDPPVELHSELVI